MISIFLTTYPEGRKSGVEADDGAFFTCAAVTCGGAGSTAMHAANGVAGTVGHCDGKCSKARVKRDSIDYDGEISSPEPRY